MTFTVTVENPTNVTASDVTLVDTLPTELTWTLPPGCAAGGGGIATCDLGDMAGGASVDLLFTATPGPSDCGTFTNSAEGFIGSDNDRLGKRHRDGRGAMPAAAGRSGHPHHQDTDLHQRLRCPARSRTW